MLVNEAIQKYIEKITEAEREAERARQAQERVHEAERQRWINAMRERFSLQYGLEIAYEDVEQWRVEKTGPRYHLFWYRGEGYIAPRRDLTCQEVISGEDLLWDASWKGTMCIGFSSPIAALTFAQTGKAMPDEANTDG